MKYILFILLIPVFCFGQKIKDKTFITDSVGGFTGFKIIYPYTVYTYDRGKLIDSCIVNWDSDDPIKGYGDPLMPNGNLWLNGGGITSTGTIELDTVALKEGIKNGFHVDYDTLNHTYYIKGLVKHTK